MFTFSGTYLFPNKNMKQRNRKYVIPSYTVQVDQQLEIPEAADVPGVV
jgi:hypothetical protein